MPTPEAGGPYTIELSDGERLTLRDVLIGEVWLCSGQSNMEMPVHGIPDQPVAGSAEAVREAASSPTGTKTRMYGKRCGRSWVNRKSRLPGRIKCVWKKNSVISCLP